MSQFYWSNLAVLLTYCRTKELRCTNKIRLRTSVTHFYMYGPVLEIIAGSQNFLLKIRNTKSEKLRKSEVFGRFVSKSFHEAWR